jgi:hypothetical protein
MNFPNKNKKPEEKKPEKKAEEKKPEPQAVHRMMDYKPGHNFNYGQYFA